ncbi:MAG: TonB-dependent receptor [Gammaproteobacteria bacterium]
MRSDARIKPRADGKTGNTGKKSAPPRIVAAAGFLSMLAAFPGFADAPADAGELGEIVVTAQRRAERLMDVPMSIQAFSQQNLDQQGVRSVDDLTRVAPGVTFLRNGMSSSGNYNDEDSDISIRGIDSAAGAATTGIYIDDTPIQTRHLNFGTVNPYPVLFDLDRVEVLKGPQGTLFGAGSEGGTIRFITPEPSLTTYSGYARAEYGKIDGGGSNYEAGAAFGGPLIDGVLGFRVSASFREDGGWVNRVNYTRPPSTLDPATFATIYSGNPVVTDTTEKNANWHDTQTFRAALKWQPVEGLTVEPSIYVQTLHINDTGAYWLNISNPSDNVYNNGNAQRDPSTDPWYLGSLKVSWNLPWATIVSNTSYFDRQQHSVSDYSQWFDTVFFYNQYPPVGEVNSSYFTDHQNNFNEEIRVSSVDSNSRLQWTAGLFYTHTNENSTEYVVSDAACAGNTCPVSQPGLPAGAETYLQPRFSMLDKQAAIFGEVSYKFTDVLKFTAGLRYSDLQYYGVVQEQEQGLFGTLNVNTPSSGSSRPVTPRFVLNYQPNTDTLFYASAAKGFRPGGINTTLPDNCFNGTGVSPQAAAAPFSSDSLWQYEIGTKDSLLDRRMTVSAAIYYIKWKNIQQFIYLACGLGIDYNTGEVTGKGGDIEIQWRALDALTLGITASYTDASFDDNVVLGSSDRVVTAGDHLQASPWNLDLNGEYVWTANDIKPYLRLDYQFATAQRSLVPYTDPENNPNADATLPGLPQTRVLNLRAGVRLNGVDVSLFANNALNYHTPIFVSRDFNAPGYGLPNLDTNYFGRGYAPRTVGVTATYKF